jgi:hypothetical protein
VDFMALNDDLLNAIGYVLQHNSHLITETWMFSETSSMIYILRTVDYVERDIIKVILTTITRL